MTISKKLHLISVLAISIGALYTNSQNRSGKNEISGVVGKEPATLLSIADSVTTDTLNDSISLDFLNELFSIFEDERELQLSGTDSVENIGEAISVLDFVTQAYDKNSFYDAGSWSKPSGKRQPKIYDGPLPSIDESKLYRPVKGKVTSSFGYRNNSDKIHLGVDMAGKKGDTVRVAIPGKVTNCRFDRKGYGWYVSVVDSAGIETRYAHLSKVLVKRGDILGYAEPVGLVGATGNSTGPHLHFEVRYKGRVINPMLYLMK